MKQVAITPQGFSEGALYSHAVRIGNLVFTSGYTGFDPRSKVLQEGIKEQTRQALDNLKEILHAAGTSFDKVVKVNIFLADMADYAQVNEVYKEYFNGPVLPARACVANCTLSSKEKRIEIEMVAFVE